MSDASGSGERKATTSMSSRSTMTIGLVVAVGGFVISTALWAQKIADDVGSIKTSLTDMVKDHEARIRTLESHKP